MRDNVVIEVNKMSKRFKKIVALDHISLHIFHNEIFGLIGPNGSGKTTLLRILCTLIKPDQRSPGSSKNSICKIVGHDLLTAQSEIRKKIGYVPQQDALYNDLSALDNLIYFSTPYCPDKIVQRKRIIELLDLLKLHDRRHDLVKTYSGGMKKRLSIACALVHHPEILFLDEITVGLDTSLRHEIWALLEEQKKTSTIVITTHYIPEAEKHCDRVALMLNGRILQFGAPGDLVSRHKPAANLEEVMLIYEKNPA
jgi:ABC-2 type transport system ATP-binding protein